jgi:hypothetical protein
MTQFINAENIATARKERKETVFTHVLNGNKWADFSANVGSYNLIIFLGTCNVDGDMFAAYKKDGGSQLIEIYKGIKGDEFND